MTRVGEHTEWHIVPDPTGQTIMCTIRAADGLGFKSIADDLSEKDAAFIVRACNAHDELVDALIATTELLEGFREHPIDQDLDDDEAPIIAPVLDQAKSAIARARGEAQ